MKELKVGYPIEEIALSGYGTEDNLRKSWEAGFSARPVKPRVRPNPRLI